MNVITSGLSRRRLSKAYEAVKTNDLESLIGLSPNPNQKYTYNTMGIDLPVSLLDCAMRAGSYQCAQWLLDNGAFPYPTDSFSGELYMLQRRKIDHLMREQTNFYTGESDGLVKQPKSYIDNPQLTLALSFYRAQKLHAPTSDVLDVHRWTNVSSEVKQWFESQLPTYEANLSRSNPYRASLK